MYIKFWNNYDTTVSISPFRTEIALFLIDEIQIFRLICLHLNLLLEMESKRSRFLTSGLWLILHGIYYFYVQRFIRVLMHAMQLRRNCLGDAWEPCSIS